MPKFFVKNEQIKNYSITIIGDDVNHIVNVLRMKKGDEIQVCNRDTGDNYNTEITQYSKNEVECEIKEKINETTESNVNITLFQGIPKFEKMELIIQKNTEVGVKNIVPVIMERTIVKLDEKIAGKKLERWQKIAEIAAKQSMRDIIPQVKNIIKLKDVNIDEFDAVLVAYENEEHNMLKTELKKLETEFAEKLMNVENINQEEKNEKTNADNAKITKNYHDNNTNNIKEAVSQYNIAIVIGPEGGISEKEIELLKEKGAKFVSLGRRILRTETAGIVMSGNIMYELESSY